MLQSRPPMENYNYYWERPPPPAAAPPRHRKNSPSFSSSLLDAITRSIDDSDSSVAAGREPHRPRNPSGGAPDPATRRNYSSSSSTSSSSSSFFLSSDADTPIRIRPIRTGPVLSRSDRIRSDPPLENPNQTQKQQKQLTSIKKKLRELRRSAGPASPGARLAGFLNSLFHPAGAGKTKMKPSASASSGSSSSCSRSCLSKTPSTRGSGGGKRSVRFSPVGVIVGEDCRPCGEKVVFAGDFPAEAAAPARKAAVVEELMRAVAMEEDYESDSSEDLFELENLGGILGADDGKNSGNASFRDELPVYETTSLGINRAIARGLIV
ncbi:protein BIG GRAIN 1-like [Iris pallida]|uniref:Protein BIG GRAIN 1-like n=1 Tax=Iris pallida TaxID=29817 RepID=A0AAX6IFL9_IRIPA|nr:protein BIG GRAIN 1-like [Iris pallida]